MRSFKVTGLTIATIAAFIALFKPEGLQDSIRYVIQISMILVALAYVLSRRTKVSCNVILYIAIPICISSILAYFDRIISFNNLINCFFYMISLWTISQIIMIWAKKDKYLQLINLLQKIAAVYCALSVISVITVGVTYSATTTYLFGGKFTTSYFFLLYLGLTYAKNQKKIDSKGRYRTLLGVMSLIVVLFEIYLRCTTGYVITVVFYLLAILPKKIRPLLTRKVIVIAAVVASGLIPVFIDGILSIGAVQHFIVNILGKSINLTNRLPIYTIYLFPLLKERLILGHGYGSSVMHLRTSVYWNAQNGLLDIILNYGIVGCVGFLITCFKVTGNKNCDTYAWPLYAVLYALIMAATIEVSYDMMFFILLILIFVTKEYEPSQIQR